MIEKEKVRELAEKKIKEAVIGFEDDLLTVEELKDQSAREKSANNLRATLARRIINILYGKDGDRSFINAWNDENNRKLIGAIISKLLIEAYPVLKTEGIVAYLATQIIDQLAEDEVKVSKSEQKKPEPVVVKYETLTQEEIDSLPEKVRDGIKPFLELQKLIDEFESEKDKDFKDAILELIANFLKQIPNEKPFNLVLRLKISADGLGAVDQKILVSFIGGVVEKSKKLLDNVTTVSTDAVATVDIKDIRKYEFKSPASDHVDAYVAEWDRLWEESGDDKKEFIEYINIVLAQMEKAIGAFSELAKFSTHRDNKKYLALKIFFDRLGYAVDDDSDSSGGESKIIKAMHTYLHNRLSLADHFYEHGVSKGMYAEYEKAVYGTFPAFGRYVTDYFIGNTELKKRKDPESTYPFYRAVRVLDQQMTLYYDETPYDFVQIGLQPDGTPMMGQKRPDEWFIVRGSNGEALYENGVLVQGGDKKILQDKYGKDCKIEYLYGADWQFKNRSESLLCGENNEKQQPGYFSFGRAKWTASGGGFKEAMMERVVADFSHMKGVSIVNEEDEIVFYYGPENDKTRMPMKKMVEALNVAMAVNSISATRAQIFTSLYYAIGKSPYDDKNLDMMAGRYPQAKELNLAKTTMEIPYIVLGGDVSNEWLANGAIKIGLCKFILRSKELRELTGISSQEQFLEKITYAKDGVVMEDIKGLVALRELDKKWLDDDSILNNSEIYKSLASDLPRFRALLRSIYISRLKRDLLKLKFLPSADPKLREPSLRTTNVLAHQRTELERFDLSKKNARNYGSKEESLLRPFVMTPRMLMVETDYDFDLSLPDTSSIGLAAKSGVQLHENIKREVEGAIETYKKANASLPSLTGDVNKDIKIVAHDIESFMKQTSPLKQYPEMIDWVYFFELMQMRVTRLIFLFREKHNIFQKRLLEPGEKMMGKKVANHTVIEDLREQIWNTGQTGVGDSLIFDPIQSEKAGQPKFMHFKRAVLSFLPDEEDGPEIVGNFWDNIMGLFTAEGINSNNQIGKARIGLYAGGIKQRSMLLEVQNSPYANALERYHLLDNLDPEIGSMTNTGMQNESSEVVKNAKASQEAEKK